MQAAWYEKYGPAREVIQIGELDTPQAGAGNVRVRLYASGVNPSGVKSDGLAWPLEIPQSCTPQ